MTDLITAEEAQKLLSQMREWWEYDHGNLIPRAAAMIEALNAELAAANAREAGLREALTPSGDTKAAYMGEVKDPDTKRMVSWTAIKMVMAMIAARTAQPSTEGTK